MSTCQKPLVFKTFGGVKLQLKRARPATTGAKLLHGDLRMESAVRRAWRLDHDIALVPCE